jgi:rod shape-determining protein MreD
MDPLRERPRRNPYGSPLNRVHSPILAGSVPWLSILLGSMCQILPVASAMPLMPPTGFVMLLCWRLIRPGLLPVWAGIPLGLFDDLLSGQPLGSAIMLWSATLLVVELVEARVPWREFRLDWLFAMGILAAYLLLAALVSGGQMSWPVVGAVAVQYLFTCLLYPGMSRLVGWLDRLRLYRFKEMI